MKDYSIPPYILGEIGMEVKRLGEILNIECNLAHAPWFKANGYFSLPTLSEDIVRMASIYGIHMTVTGDLEETAKQLQYFLTELRKRGIRV